MTDRDPFSACPVLKEALDRNPALRPSLEALCERGLCGVFPKYLTDASAQAVATMLGEVATLDLDRIELHRQALKQGERRMLTATDVEPILLVTREEQEKRRSDDAARGLESLETGRWASVAFAGGAGTRFFSQLDQLHRALPQPNERLRSGRFDPSDPKGVFPITPVGGLSFYETILAQALHVGVRTGRLPWVLLLTSHLTHERTLRFLGRRDLWGFPKGEWIAFRQALVPRLDGEGDLIVADDQGHLSQTGDGHGGVYRALLSSRKEGKRLIDFLQERGVSQLIMHNVDNPAALPFNPVRLGFHLRENALFTLSAVRRTDPGEKVGVLLLLKSSGKVEVVEYNVLDPAVARARDEKSGRLLYEAGNTNTNLIALEAVRTDIEPTLYTGKKIGSRNGPVEGSSLEILNQHITRLLDPARIRAFEVSRAEFFFPTKNITGVDSVESSTRMLSDAFARRLRAAGACIDEGASVDLHPACGSSGGELQRQGIGPGWRMETGSRLYLCLSQMDDAQEPIGEGPLTLESGSCLILEAARPYGRVRVDETHAVRVDRTSAGRVRIGAGVVIRSGIRVCLRVGPGARLTIPAGRIVDQDIQAEVGPGEEREL